MQPTLQETDPEMYDLITKEKLFQKQSLNLIAAENYASKAVLQALGSCLGNKYSKGRPGKRYYAGNEFIDKIELLCEKRALEAFHLNPDEWGVNVQPVSGTPANIAVYMAMVGPHGRIMGLDYSDGGHLSHGFVNLKKKMSASSIFFESMPFKVNPQTGYIDYDNLEQTARVFKPALIITGFSGYPRNIDYARFRKIADEVDCVLMGDMAHISGMVSAGVVSSPFEYADIVTTTTQKSMRGPRSAMIFYRKGVKKVLKDGTKIIYDMEEKINEAVFPGLQGGPHNQKIGALAVSLKEMMTSEYKIYQKQILINSKVLANELIKLGYVLSSGGTENHLVLVDLRPLNLDGIRCESVLELMNISSNKYPYPGDKDAFLASGIRFGTPALTTRGFTENDMKIVAQFLHKGIQLAKEVASMSPTCDFNQVLDKNASVKHKLEELREEVKKYAENFPMPGMEI